jgi:hypothetical protein
VEEVAEGQDRLVKLGELAALSEQPFASGVPVVGPLIAAFRTAWNNVSTRWYVRPMAHQQSLFNLSTVDELAALRAENQALRAELARLQEWLIAQDREQTDLQHDLAELALVVGQHRRALEAIRPTDPPA